jgi:hypothetical protein
MAFQAAWIQCLHSRVRTAVHLEEVELAQDLMSVGGVAADEIEYGKPAIVADDGLAVDNA